jgi:hypothetical protein
MVVETAAKKGQHLVGGLVELSVASKDDAKVAYWVDHLGVQMAVSLVDNSVELMVALMVANLVVCWAGNSDAKKVVQSVVSMAEYWAEVSVA